MFERNPQLRFGVLELRPPGRTLAKRLDLWAEEIPVRFASTLRWPVGIFAPNVRVTPFHFEPVAMYFERYPNLADVYCYSTDYPHFEGGKESKRVFSEALSGVSAELRDKFFFQNATLLLPE